MSDIAIRDKGELAQRQPASLLEAVMLQVGNPDMDPARLREFLEIGKELEAREAKKQFNSAMAEMRPKMPVIKKNGLIVYGKSGSTPFAKWDDIHRACMHILDEHGFTVSFDGELINGNAQRRIMTVRHTGGHEEKPSLTVPWLDKGGSKSDGQAAVSAATLADRHLFLKYFNILTEDQDDDGTGGKGVPEQITQEQADQIRDIVDCCAEKDDKMKANFSKWIKQQFGADSSAQLFQGEQYDSVMAMLRDKLKRLGIA